MSTPHRHGHLPPRLSFRAASRFEAHGQLAEAERRRLALREQLVQHLGGAAALPSETTLERRSTSGVSQSIVCKSRIEEELRRVNTRCESSSF